jgi:carbonic anhydrase/acetyltransferase-like protein (isoleucine patch superfamily)
MTVIGERSIVMEGSVISSKAILLPGTVVPPAKLIPKHEVWGGNPAAFERKLTHDEVRKIQRCSGALCSM